MNVNPQHGKTEGPLGFPMTDKAARAVETILRELPRTKEYAYRKAMLPQAATELNPGERSDVSWISTQAVDLVHEVVLAAGMDDSQFAQNPIVTLNHAYQIPPVGRSLWHKRVRDGSTYGIKAKTLYPQRPASWPAAEPWMPDKIFGLVQAGLVGAKSIGFLPLKVRAATQTEVQQNDWPSDVVVIDAWLLLEYACCWLPANQEAIVEEVSKNLSLPAGVLDVWRGGPLPIVGSKAISFTPEEEIVKALHRRLDRFDPAAFFQEAMDRVRGIV
jgi:hypothetical protein